MINLNSGPISDEVYSATAGRKSIVVGSHLGPAVNELVANHPSKPTVMQLPTDRPFWELPGDIDVLLTSPGGWKAAPMEKPASWPSALKWIQVESVGIDAYPRWLFDGVTFTCARGFNAPSIAEYVVAHMMRVEKRIDDCVARSPSDWKHIDMGGLAGKTLGIVGFGSIGSTLAALAEAFDMRVLAFKRSAWEKKPEGVEIAESLDEIFSSADHLVMALPATPATRKMIDANVFAKAKDGMHFINISRGSVVDQDALLAAIDAGKLGWATLDVTDPEPLPGGHAFYSHPRIRLTPHISWDGPGNARRLQRIIAENFDAFARNQPLQNLVDVVQGY